MVSHHIVHCWSCQRDTVFKQSQCHYFDILYVKHTICHIYYSIKTLEKRRVQVKVKSKIVYITLLLGYSWTGFVSNVSSPSQDQQEWQLCSCSGILLHE